MNISDDGAPHASGSHMARTRWKTILRITGITIAGAVIVAQFVPYGHDHTNPPVVAEPPWDSPATRSLAQRACFDCHSNETRWPWYSSIAPTSWLLQSHVDDGRRELNYSEWQKAFDEANEAGKTVRQETMPPRSYLLIHPEARLSATEREQLARGLDASSRSAQTTAED